LSAPIQQVPANSRGRDRGAADHRGDLGAEGATAPETLRQTDRKPMAL
jgi:hypothetical protein